MATTSPDNIRTPDQGDQYALTQDLGVLADTVQDALTRRANTFRGTVAQRTAFTSTATDGMLWQDTDGMKMIWRKDGAAWAPAVWRWSGTTTQMNSFTAPDGFEWLNTTDSSDYVRIGGAWRGNTEWATVASGVRWRRFNDTIFAEFGVSATVASGATRVVGTLPPEARPPQFWPLAGFADAIYNLNVRVNTVGSIEVRNTNSSQVGSLYGAGSWPAP